MPRALVSGSTTTAPPLYFGKPDGGGSDESLTFGSNLFSFDIGLSVRRGNMELQHYAYAKNEILKATDGDAGTVAVDSTTYGTPAGQASKGMFKNGSVEYLGNAADRSEVKQRLRAQRVAVATDTVVLRGVSDNTRLGVGKYVKVSGPPDRDQGGTIDYGRFLIVGISHSSGHGNYQNQFEAIPADSDMVPSFAGSGTVLGEAQVAVVKEVDDPDKMGRVKVQFLWQRGTPELSPWIRVTSAHASGSSGQYHIPEVDEEVLVDFEFGDPEMPVVTGSLYHGKAKPDSAWATPKNEVKAYRTKSGNEIIISDKAGKESIQVRNKDGKNEVTLTLGAEPTIVLKTDGKLTLDASTIEIEVQDVGRKNHQRWHQSDTELKLEVAQW
ncbi:MAG: hypothetical protein IPI07_18620 [Flavobacteriales bacterium]|nr:hypothetical protein [Flavobacteriales bacterium]